MTPLPVILDDRVRTVERELEPIAAAGRRSAQYRMQITPGTGLFGVQRSIGGVVIRRSQASLPLVDAGARRARAAPARTPRRLSLKVSSRRVDGRARVTITTRLRSKPCSGTVTFTVTAAGRPDAHDRARAELLLIQVSCGCESRAGRGSRWREVQRQRVAEGALGEERHASARGDGARRSAATAACVAPPR